MRNVIILLLTAVMLQLLVAQTTASQNYILSCRPLNTAGTAAIETVTYVDGLGLPVETVQKGAAPDGGDIVSMKEYDGNHLTKVTDWARTSLTAKDAMHFIDGSDTDVEYEYDANSNMTRDLNRDIVAVKYNRLGLPAAIAFNNKAIFMSK